MSCDYSITIDTLLIHAEVVASVGNIHVIFLELAIVEKELESFSGSQLVLRVMLINPSLTSTQESFFFNSIPPLGKWDDSRELS